MRPGRFVTVLARIFIVVSSLAIAVTALTNEASFPDGDGGSFFSTRRCGSAAPGATAYGSVGRGPRGGAAPPRERRRRVSGSRPG